MKNQLPYLLAAIKPVDDETTKRESQDNKRVTRKRIKPKRPLDTVLVWTQTPLTR